MLKLLHLGVMSSKSEGLGDFEQSNTMVDDRFDEVREAGVI